MEGTRAAIGLMFYWVKMFSIFGNLLFQGDDRQDLKSSVQINLVIKLKFNS